MKYKEKITLEQLERMPADELVCYAIKAFLAAYHGNITTDDGRPTSFESWDEYNDLIDRQGE